MDGLGLLTLHRRTLEVSFFHAHAMDVPPVFGLGLEKISSLVSNRLVLCIVQYRCCTVLYCTVPYRELSTGPRPGKSSPVRYRGIVRFGILYCRCRHRAAVYKILGGMSALREGHAVLPYSPGYPQCLPGGREHSSGRHFHVPGSVRKGGSFCSVRRGFMNSLAVSPVLYWRSSLFRAGCCDDEGHR